MTFEQELHKIAVQQLHDMKEIAERGAERLTLLATQHGVADNEVGMLYMQAMAEAAPTVMGADMGQQKIASESRDLSRGEQPLEKMPRQRPPSHRKIMAGDTHSA